MPRRGSLKGENAIASKRSHGSATTSPPLSESQPVWALAILNDAVDGILTIDERGIVQWMNPAAEKLFGYGAEEVVGQNVKVLMPPPDREHHDSYIANYVRTGEKRIIGIGREVLGRRKDGTTFAMYLSVCESIVEGQRIFGGIVRDLTDRKLREQELRRERDFTRRLLDTAEAIVLLLDARGRIVLYNQYMERLSGRPLAEVRERDWFDSFVPERERARARWLFKQAMEGRTIRGNVYPVIMKDGDLRQVEWFEGVLDDESRSLLCIGLDITERMKAEEERYAYEEKLRSLTAELIASEERERKELATVLHDEIGQMLALARIQLGALGDAVPKSLRTSVSEINELVRQAVQSSRSVMAELGATVLHELGLEAALAALVEESRRRHGIDFTFLDDRQPKPLNVLTRTILYRSARELMVNVVKHSGAKRAEVAVRREESTIRVRVHDDGQGFIVPTEGFHASKEGGFGLFSIQERLGRLGGALSVTSNPGSGTTVILEAPLADEGDAEAGDVA